jgi:hypothetical protein
MIEYRILTAAEICLHLLSRHPGEVAKISLQHMIHTFQRLGVNKVLERYIRAHDRITFLEPGY